MFRAEAWGNSYDGLLFISLSVVRLIPEFREWRIGRIFFLLSASLFFNETLWVNPKTCDRFLFKREDIIYGFLACRPDEGLSLFSLGGYWLLMIKCG